eukprot:scaffold132368_cov60-Phaeocystis_antarctica.AAC.1
MSVEALEVPSAVSAPIHERRPLPGRSSRHGGGDGCATSHHATRPLRRDGRGVAGQSRAGAQVAGQRDGDAAAPLALARERGRAHHAAGAGREPGGRARALDGHPTRRALHRGQRRRRAAPGHGRVVFRPL